MRYLLIPVFVLFFLTTFGQNGPTIPRVGDLPIGKILTWKSEGNVSSFFVQRSDDGVSFKTIGKVDAQDSLKNKYYTFLDASLAKENVYYRIAEASHTTGIQYSDAVYHSSPMPNNIVLKRINNTHIDKVALVEFESAVRAEGNYTVKTNIQEHTFTVYEKPFPVFVGKNILSIEVAHLDPGFYQVEMQVGQESEKFSFVKKTSKSEGGVIVVKK